MRKKQEDSEYWDDPIKESRRSYFFNQKSLYISIFTIFTLVIGNTLAANINLNTGNKVEFGQGVAQATSCDDSIKVIPYSSFENVVNKRFVVSGVELSGVDSQSGKCAGKYFEINFYGLTGPSLGKYVIFDDGSSFISGDGTITSSATGTSNSQVKLSIPNGNIASKDAYKLTLESKNLENLTSPTISYAADIATSGSSWVKIVICFSNSTSDSYAQSICPTSSGTEIFTKVEVVLPPNAIWTSTNTPPILNETTSSGFACTPTSNFNATISADQTKLIYDGFSCRVNPSIPQSVFALGNYAGTYGSPTTPTFVSPTVSLFTSSGSVVAKVANNFAFTPPSYRYPNGIPCMAIVASGTHQCWEAIP